MRKTAFTIAGLAMLGSWQVLGPVIKPSNPQEKSPSTINRSEPESTKFSAVRDEASPAAALCKYFLTHIDQPVPHRALWFEDEREVTPSGKSYAIHKAVTTRVRIDPALCLPPKYIGGAEFLISTVPDPINSHLTLEYDRSLESIERAAAAAGYSFDRYWLPWNQPYTQPQDDVEKIHLAERERRLREEEPGILMFHRASNDPASPELLIIFLAGETPSSGLNKPAMEKAIRYVERLEKKMPAIDALPLSRVKIAGPNLSASLHSMGILLQDILAERVRNHALLSPIRIISGSVTNYDAIESLKGISASIAKDAGAPVTFQSLSFDDNEQSKPIIAELRRITGASTCEIALIRETASGYQGPRTPNASNATDPCTDSSGPLVLDFPRDIAPLRNAYQEAQESLVASKSREVRQLPQVSLPMSYRESAAQERDTVPALAQNQTPVSQDAVMQQIVQTLRQRKIKAIVVSATSTLDTLFLLHYFGEFTPDIRIALPRSDLLYIRTGEPRDFTGTVVFNEYPLFVTSTVFPDMKFTSTLAERLFFSVLVTLRPGLVYEEPFPADQFPERQFWMGVVGKTAYWPVHFPLRMPNPGATSASFQASVFATPPPGWLWYFFLSLISAAAAMHCWAFVAANCPGSDKKWWWEYYAVDHGGRGEYQQARACYLLLGTINVAVAQFVVLAPSWRLYQETHQKPLAWFCGLSLIVFLCSIFVVIICAGIATLIRPRLKPLDGDNDRSARISSCGATFICLAALTVILIAWHQLSFGPDGLYFSYRSAFLLSGVCPALPILFIALGVYTYAMGSLRRATYFQNRFASLPSGFDCILHTDFKSLQNDLARSLRPDTFISFMSSKIWWLPLGLLVVAIVLGASGVGPSGIEGRIYDVIVFAGICAIWAALLSTVLRFWDVWEVSRKMLRRLERQPIRYAFNRIPGLFSWTPIWRLGGIKRSMLVHSRSLEYLRCLGADTAVSDALLVSDIEVEKVRSKLDDILRLESQALRITYKQWHKLDFVLIKMTDQLVQCLVPIWKAGGADSGSKEWNTRRKDLPRGPGWRSDQEHRVMLAAEFVALRFVAVIRYISLQMRNMLAMMSFGFVLLVLALESYPFQPRERIGWWILGTFAALSASILYVFRGLGKDLILKRLAAARPGKFDIAFLWPAIKFGVLPILTVLASQFPALSNFLFSWLEPALDSLH